MPRPTKAAQDLAAHEARIVAGATYWTAYVRSSPHETRKAERPTRGEAIEAGVQFAGETGRKALIYAVDGNGRSVMVGSVDAAGAFASAIAD